MMNFGWKPDVPDQRDKRFKLPKLIGPLPEYVDLRAEMPKVYQQGSLGSCTSQSVGALAEFLMKKEGYAKPFTPSRLSIYYNTRVLEDTVDWDSGASLRNAIKSVCSNGCPHESLWWYNPPKFTVKPNKKVYADGKKYVLSSYERLDNANIDELRSCLASGYPFVFGFAVYESFMSDNVAKTGMMEMPSPNEIMRGGHAVLCCGFDCSKRHFIVRNSWGAEWASKGYFYMPFDFIADKDFCDDFWVCRKITPP